MSMTQWGCVRVSHSYLLLLLFDGRKGRANKEGELSAISTNSSAIASANKYIFSRVSIEYLRCHPLVQE